MMPIASCVPFPFSAPCDDMLTMLVCATRWLSMHLYMLAYMSMHESCLLMCRPYFNTMRLWTFDPNLHLSLTDTTIFLLSCLFACFLTCLLAFLFLCLPCLSCLSALCLFHIPFASFPSITCLLVSCLYLCMYTHGARTLGARALSPRHKQKGCKWKHVDMSPLAMFNKFRGLVSPFLVMYSFKPLPSSFLSLLDCLY